MGQMYKIKSYINHYSQYFFLLFLAQSQFYTRNRQFFAIRGALKNSQALRK